MTPPIETRAALDDATRDELAAVVGRHQTLEQVVRWTIALPPPGALVEVIVQDEFTHDVVVAWRASLHLVYDTT